jgi:hypothetical protein
VLLHQCNSSEQTWKDEMGPSETLAAFRRRPASRRPLQVFLSLLLLLLIGPFSVSHTLPPRLLLSPFPSPSFRLFFSRPLPFFAASLSQLRPRTRPVVDRSRYVMRGPGTERAARDKCGGGRGPGGRRGGEGKGKKGGRKASVTGAGGRRAASRSSASVHGSKN